MFAHRSDPGRGVEVAFTDRHDGVSLPPYDSLNLGRTDVDDPVRVGANIAAVTDALGAAAAPVVALNQQHTADVLVVDRAWLGRWDDGRGWRSPLGSSIGGRPLPVADALVTAEPGIVLLIRVADCLPVVLADPDAGVVAAVHAGRVGLAAGIVPAAVAAMRGLGADRITAWIGPHVCGPCYEVPEAMAADVAERVPHVRAVTAGGTAALDLAAGAASQLRSAGCGVAWVGGCTVEDPGQFSHRRDGVGSGRSAGLVWRRPTSPPGD